MSVTINQYAAGSLSIEARDDEFDDDVEWGEGEIAVLSFDDGGSCSVVAVSLDDLRVMRRKIDAFLASFEARP